MLRIKRIQGGIKVFLLKSNIVTEVVKGFMRAQDKSRKGHGQDKDISSDIDVSARDLRTLQEEEISGVSQRGNQSAAYSDTDEDENEGLGDGNLGRSTREGS